MIHFVTAPAVCAAETIAATVPAVIIFTHSIRDKLQIRSDEEHSLLSDPFPFEPDSSESAAMEDVRGAPRAMDIIVSCRVRREKGDCHAKETGLGYQVRVHVHLT